MYLCLRCSANINPQDPRLFDEEHPFYGGCPECGETGIPADLDDSVNIKITWHELRVIVMWAERWASANVDKPENKSMLETVYGIADRVQFQHIDKPGLTFRSELTALSEAGYKITQNVIKEN